MTAPADLPLTCRSRSAATAHTALWCRDHNVLRHSPAASWVRLETLCLRADVGECVSADLAEWLSEADMGVVDRLTAALYDIRGGVTQRRPGVSAIEAARVVVLLDGTRIDKNFYATNNVDEDQSPLF